MGQSRRPADNRSSLSTSDWGIGLLIAKSETLRRVERTTPGHRVSHSGGHEATLGAGDIETPFSAAVCPQKGTADGSEYMATYQCAQARILKHIANPVYLESFNAPLPVPCCVECPSVRFER
jgi:predicted alpha/beta hydrolase